MTLKSFNDIGVNIELIDGDRLKVTGLSSLPCHRADEVRAYIRENRESVLQDLRAGDCPARCRISGLCFGKAYFEAKAGSGVACTPENCPWMKYRRKI